MRALLPPAGVRGKSFAYSGRAVLPLSAEDACSIDMSSWCPLQVLET